MHERAARRRQSRLRWNAVRDAARRGAAIAVVVLAGCPGNRNDREREAPAAAPRDPSANVPSSGSDQGAPAAPRDEKKARITAESTSEIDALLRWTGHVRRAVAYAADLRRNGARTATVDGGTPVVDMQVLAIKSYQSLGALEVTGVLDAATVEDMNKPRCGNPDVAYDKLVYGISNSLWSGRHDLSVCVTGVPAGVDEAGLDASLREACKFWSGLCDLRLNIVVDAAKADILIASESPIHTSIKRGPSGQSQPCWPFDASEIVLAHGLWPIADNQLNAGEVHLDGAVTWKDFDLTLVLAHELGHALGLGDHSPNLKTVMFRRYDGVALTADDEVTGALELLFGKKKGER